MENNECLFCKKRWEAKHIENCVKFKKVLNDDFTYTTIPCFYSKETTKFRNFEEALKILFCCEKFRKITFDTISQLNPRCNCLFCGIRMFFCKILVSNSTCTEMISFEYIENSEFSSYVDGFEVDSVMDALNVLLKDLERLECSKKLNLASFFNLQLSTTFKCSCQEVLKMQISKFSLKVSIKDQNFLKNLTIFEFYRNSLKEKFLKICKTNGCKFKKSLYQDENIEIFPEYLILEVSCDQPTEFQIENFDFDLKIKGENLVFSQNYSIFLIEARNQHNESFIYKYLKDCWYDNTGADFDNHNMVFLLSTSSPIINLIIYRKEPSAFFETTEKSRTRQPVEKFQCSTCGYFQATSNNQCLRCPKVFSETCKKCRSNFHSSLKSCPNCERTQSETHVLMNQELKTIKCNTCQNYQPENNLECISCKTKLNKKCDNCNKILKIDAKSCLYCDHVEHQISPEPKKNLKVKCNNCRTSQSETNTKCYKCKYLLTKICQICNKEYSINEPTCPFCQKAKVKIMFTSNECPNCGKSVINGRKCENCFRNSGPVKVFNIDNQSQGKKSNGVYECSNCKNLLKNQNDDCPKCSVPTEEKPKIPLKYNICQVCNRRKDSDICKNCELKNKSNSNLTKSYNPEAYSDLTNSPQIDSPSRFSYQTGNPSIQPSPSEQKPLSKCPKCNQTPCSTTCRRSSSINPKTRKCSFCFSSLTTTEKRNCGNCYKKQNNISEYCKNCRNTITSSCDSCMKKKINK